MKLSMRLTLDGLVHAMRLKAHETAEAVENGRADGSVRDQRSGGHLGAKGTGTGFISFPGSLSVGEANRLIKAFMRRIWDGRESVSFAVPQSERRLEAGSILRLPEEENGPDFLVDEVEDGLVRRVHARRIVRSADAPVWEPDAPGGTEPSRSFVPATPHVLFLDLPMRTSQERPQDQLRIAARAIPWRRQAVLASPEETGFALRTSLSARAVIGA